MKIREFFAKKIYKKARIVQCIGFFLCLIFIFFFSSKIIVKAEPILATINGQIFTDISATENLETTVDISLAVNGVYLDTLEIEDGTYSFPDISIEDGDVLTIYLDGGETRSVSLTKVSTGQDNSTITSNLYVNYLTFNSTGSDPVTRDDYNLANNVDDADINHFYNDGYDFYTFNDRGLLITENTTFSIEDGYIILSGELFLASNATVNAGGMYLRGNLNNYGAITSSVIGLDGSNEQTIFSNGSIASNINLSKTEGSVSLASNLDIGIGSVVIGTPESVFNLTDYTLFARSIEVGSGDFIMGNGYLDLDDEESYINIYDGGYLEANDSSISVMNLNVGDSSTFISTSETLYVQGMTVNGTFDHNNGTVVLTGDYSWIEGASTTEFYNLQKVDDTEDEITQELSVRENKILIILRELVLEGNGTDLLSIYSNGEFPFYIEMSGEDSVVYANNLDIYNSHIEAVDGSLVTIPINPSFSTDGGATSGWFPTYQTIVGTALTPDGSEDLGADHEIKIAINGSEVTTVTTDSDGFFIAEDLAVSNNDIVLLYLTGNLEVLGTTVLKMGEADEDEEFTRVDIYQDYLTLDGRSSNPITESDLLSGHTGVGAVLYNQSYLDEYNLLDTTASLFVPEESVVELNAAGNIQRDLWIDGTLTFEDGNSIGVKQDVTIYGELNMGDLGETLFLDGGGEHNLYSETAIPTQIIINNNTSITLQSNLSARNITINNGSSLDCNEDYSTSISRSLVINNFSEYSCSGEGDLSLDDDITMNNSAFLMEGSGELSVGDIDITNGSSFTASSGETHIRDSIEINNESVFFANDGTVVFDNLENEIIGSFTFNNLSKVLDDDSEYGLIEFRSDSLIQILGELELSGFDEENPLLLRSHAEGAFQIEMVGFATFGTLDYLDIANGHIFGTDSLLDFPANPTNSFNSGSTTGWFGLSISGQNHGSEPNTPATFIISGATNNTGIDIPIEYEFSGGTALAGVDYDDSTTSVDLEYGSNTAIITVPIMDNSIENGTKTIEITLISADDYYAIDTTPATRNIVDNENPEPEPEPEEEENTQGSNQNNSQQTQNTNQTSEPTDTTKVILNNFFEFASSTGKTITDLKVGQFIYFNVTKNDILEEHKVTILEIGENYVLIKIESDPIEVTIFVGESRNFDVTGDGIDDIVVTLNAVGQDQSDITFRQLQEVPDDSYLQTTTDINEPVVEDIEEAATGINLWPWIIIILIISGIIGIYFYSRREKSEI